MDARAQQFHLPTGLTMTGFPVLMKLVSESFPNSGLDPLSPPASTRGASCKFIPGISVIYRSNLSKQISHACTWHAPCYVKIAGGLD